jgi:hypothetical protein
MSRAHPSRRTAYRATTSTASGSAQRTAPGV